MQFYRNHQRHVLRIIIGSRSHHYNKRRQLNAVNTNDFINTALGMNSVGLRIEHQLKIHHVGSSSATVRAFKPLITKHRNQIIYGNMSNQPQYLVNPVSVHNNRNCAKKYQFLLKLEKLQYKSMMWHYQKMLAIISNNKQQIILSNPLHKRIILKRIKADKNSVNKDISYITKNIHLREKNKPAKIIMSEMISDVYPYILSECDNDDGITSDEKAGLYINELDDYLESYLDAVICNPVVQTVNQFINYMFGHYNILVKTTDIYGKPLKYWYFMLLDYKKHCPNENIKWFSEARGEYPAYTAQNIRKALKLNSVQYIHTEESLKPIMNNHAKVFLLFGDYGAGQEYFQKRLQKEFNVQPVNKWTKPAVQNLSLIDLNLKDVLYYVQKYRNIVIPIKLTMPNQRTAFHRLLDKHIPYYQIKHLLMKNKIMHQYDKQIITNAVRLHGNYLNNSYKKLTHFIGNLSLTMLIRYAKLSLVSHL